MRLRSGDLCKTGIISPAQTKSLQTSDAKRNAVQCKYLPLSHPQCGSEFALAGFPSPRGKKE